MTNKPYEYETLDWICRNGHRMFACEWRPKALEQIKAVIGIVHGMGEHSGSYEHAVERFVSEGYAVIAFDQLGHGRTEGLRGHTDSYEALLQSVDQLLIEMERRYSGMPGFLYGHSMGGNVTLNYLLRRKPALTGAIVTGPWLKLAIKPPALQLVIARMVERIYPKYKTNRPIQPDHLTTDSTIASSYGQDQLRHGWISSRFFFSVQNAGLWALEHASELSVPLLLMHAGDDKVTSIEASKQFAERAGKRCTFLEWPGLRHELHNETNRAEVFDVMIQWFDKQLGT